MNDDHAMDAEAAARMRSDLTEIAQGAGEILLGHLGRLRSEDVNFKGRRDLMTIADRESENFILAEVARRYPSHVVLAEESAAEATPERREAEWLWVVDPLDGTTNFVHQIPMFAVSIGVVHRGRPCAGIVHAPRLGETFCAVVGHGAQLNGASMKVSTTDDLADALLATGFAYRIEKLARNNLDHFQHLIRVARAVRRCGSAALDMAYVAAGRFDGFWELHLSPWDVAAGAALVMEAGGIVSDFDGGDDWLFGGSIVAANARLHHDLEHALEVSRT
jgi:myo-inositol-1(or 4)-monophosphatase